MVDETKPTILLIPGAWHAPAHYQALIDHLQRVHFDVVCPQLPTYGAISADVGLIEDAQVARDALNELVGKGKQVLILCHSYGGVVTAEAVTEAQSYRARSLAGLEGGVIGIVWLCAFALVPGNSLVGTLGRGRQPPHIQEQVSATCRAGRRKGGWGVGVVGSRETWCTKNTDVCLQPDGMLTMSNPAFHLYGDIPTDQADHWISLLKPQPAIAQSTPITHAPYNVIPSLYIYTEQDMAVPILLQKFIVKSVEAWSGTTLTIETLQSSKWDLHHATLTFLESKVGH